MEIKRISNYIMYSSWFLMVEKVVERIQKQQIRIEEEKKMLDESFDDEESGPDHDEDGKHFISILTTLFHLDLT